MLPCMGKHLMGAREIEERLQLSRQRTYQLTQRDDWPAPYDTLAMGKVWRVEDVEAWVQEHRPDLTHPAGGDPEKGSAEASSESAAPARPKPASLQDVTAELEKLRSRVESLEIARDSPRESP